MQWALFSHCPLVAPCYIGNCGRRSRKYTSFSLFAHFLQSPPPVRCCWSRTRTQSVLVYDLQPVEWQSQTASLPDETLTNPAEHDSSTVGVPFSFYPFLSELIRQSWFQGTICRLQYHANADRQWTMHTHCQLQTCRLGGITNPTDFRVNCVFVNC